jgi:hypothetical protein
MSHGGTHGGGIPRIQGGKTLNGVLGRVGNMA